LRLLFHDAAVPLHYYVSLLALGDVAAAARRADRLTEGRRLVAQALDELVGTPSPRLEQVFARARANVSPPSEAGLVFEVALDDLEGERWPLERAALQLDYGEWLRRQRRIRDARDVLTPALETFRRLRAVPWIERAEAELRAAGVRADRAAARPREELTAREHEIATLAGQGLTNREIGDRLYLSPRTVAFHLYNVFPKLGISGRAQLRAALEATDINQ
jgi:DNA-binding CsgD family transcriptional regulator